MDGPINLPDTPFHDPTLLRRARDAWNKAELEPVGLHEARHLGHASVTLTLDRATGAQTGAQGR